MKAGCSHIFGLFKELHSTLLALIEIRAPFPGHLNGLEGPGTRLVSKAPVRPVTDHRQNDLRNHGATAPPIRAFDQAAWLQGLSRDCWPIVITAREHCPDDARVLVGQRHRRHIEAARELEPARPDAASVASALDPAQSGAGPVNEQGAQVAIAALADAEQHIMIAAGVLPRYQSKPCREFPTVLEFAHIAHCGHHRGCHQWSGSFDLGQSLTALVVRKHSPDPQIVGADAFIEEAQALGNLDQALAQQPAQSIAFGIGQQLA